ncbi:MAG: TIR domain-containing protein [Chloroflexi bacterium]|nr:MAG: TIR domain-containing protein [Chloroflexota bacterium]
MAGNHEFEYDVALSFAGEDRQVADQFAALLTSRGMRVFYDEYKTAELWGKDPLTHFVNLYSRKARYCVLFISRYYPLKRWTNAERTAARERSFRDANEYILPLRLDDTDVPGVTEATGYRDLRQHSLESIVDLLEGKLSQTKGRSGPPSQSHDLRSGNV